MAGASTLSEEETYRAIGRFIFEFSQLEHTLKICVAKAAGIKDEFFAAVMSQDFALLCTMALVILPSALQSQKPGNIDHVINECRRLNDERVRVVHGLWTPQKRGGTVAHVSRTKLKPTFSRWQAGHLEKQADIARKLSTTVWGLAYPITR